MSRRGPLWLDPWGHRASGSCGWASLITGEVSCGLGPPVNKHNGPVMKTSGCNDKFQTRSFRIEIRLTLTHSIDGNNLGIRQGQISPVRFRMRKWFCVCAIWCLHTSLESAEWSCWSDYHSDHSKGPLKPESSLHGMSSHGVLAPRC